MAAWGHQRRFSALLPLVLVLALASPARARDGDRGDGGDTSKSGSGGYNWGGSYDTCRPLGQAYQALQNIPSGSPALAVATVGGLGITFSPSNVQVVSVFGPPVDVPVTRGLVILPELNVMPAAYAPLAREVAKLGYFVVIVNFASYGRVTQAMMMNAGLDYWVLAGHGQGGQIAAKIADVVGSAKVKGVVLLGSSIPKGFDLSLNNIYVTIVHSDEDNVYGKSLKDSLKQVPADALVVRLDNLEHYDFCYSDCSSSANSNNPAVKSALVSALTGNLKFAQWFTPTPRALSFGQPELLVMSSNAAGAKQYPEGGVEVTFEQKAVTGADGKAPVRNWYIFRPKDLNNVKAGYVYLPGAAVDARSYFALAFQLATRGLFVVIPDCPGRNAFNYLGAPPGPPFGGPPAQLPMDSVAGIVKYGFQQLGPTKAWVVGGHSLGGVAASVATNIPFIFKGLVMHGGGWGLNMSASSTPVCQIYGDTDYASLGSLPFVRYQAAYTGLRNPDKTTFVVVPGANHYYTGDYSYQAPDKIATISLEQQQSTFAIETVKCVLKFI